MERTGAVRRSGAESAFPSQHPERGAQRTAPVLVRYMADAAEFTAGGGSQTLGGGSRA
jgi:hypothetical protein